MLNKQQIIRLYSKGNLSTRIFLAALDAGFLGEKKFSKGDVQILADVISSIGPQGKRIDNLLSGINVEKKKAVFHFLENSGLIETQHGGGNVVYLRRPQTSI